MVPAPACVLTCLPKSWCLSRARASGTAGNPSQRSTCPLGAGPGLSSFGCRGSASTCGMVLEALSTQCHASQAVYLDDDLHSPRGAWLEVVKHHNLRDNLKRCHYFLFIRCQASAILAISCRLLWVQGQRWTAPILPNTIRTSLLPPLQWMHKSASN